MDLSGPTFFFIFGPIAIIVGLWINFYLPKLLVKKGLKKFVIPNLESKNFKLIEYEWLGPFNIGGFKSNGWIQTRVPGSWSLMAIFANVRYDTDDGIKRVTVRFGVSFLTVEEVAYSHEL